MPVTLLPCSRFLKGVLLYVIIITELLANLLSQLLLPLSLILDWGGKQSETQRSCSAFKKMF